MADDDRIPIPVSSRSGWSTAPLPRVLLAQLAGGAIAFAAALITSYGTGFTMPFLGILTAQGVIAAWIGRRLSLPRWWIPVQIILPPATVLVGTLAIPAWVFLVAFLLLLLVYWNSARGRVPLYLTNRQTWRALSSIIQSRQTTQFIDLGCGIGGALIYLAKMNPATQFVGVESAPLPYLLARIRSKLSGLANLDIRYGSLWNVSLGDYDLVYVFLSPAPMPELYEKVRLEMQPDTVFISNSFTIPGVDANQIIQVDDDRKTQLHLWRQ